MNVLTVIGLFLCLGLAAGRLVAKVKIPAVTGYLLLGIVLGVSFLNVIPEKITHDLGFIADIALVFIAFSIGGSLRLKKIRKTGKTVLILLIAETVGAFVLVFTGLLFLDVSLPLILLLAAIAASTAPAATFMVLEEFRAAGPLTDTILSVVALDDAAGIILYALAAALAKSILGAELTVMSIIVLPLFEISVSILTGLVFAAVYSRLMNKLNYYNDILALTIGILMLLGGFIVGLPSIFAKLGVGHLTFSPLLASMAFGFFIVNFSARRTQIFQTIEKITWPIYLSFFVLAGLHLNIKNLFIMGSAAGIYIVMRAVGKIGGCYLASRFFNIPKNVSKYIGYSLISQAGVAIGLAMLASREFPTLAGDIIAIVLGTVAVAELIGPPLVKWAVVSAGEAYKRRML